MIKGITAKRLVMKCSCKRFLVVGSAAFLVYEMFSRRRNKWNTYRLVQKRPFRPVSINGPISRKDDGEEPIRSSGALIWSQTSTKSIKNFGNVERSRVQSVWKGRKEFSVPEGKHAKPFCC